MPTARCSLSWINTQNGITITDTSEILSDVRNAFTTAFPNLNTDPSTPQGQIITYLTELLTEANGAIAEFGNAMTNGGSGVWLDVRNNTLYGIKRKPASPASVEATISGKIGTVIPSGFTASANGYNFITQTAATIGDNGTVKVTMYAMQDNAPSIAIGSLTEIVTPKYGVDTITNATVGVASQLAETDEAYRARASESVFYNSSALYAGLLAQLLQLDGVEAVAGYENTGNEAVTYKGTVMQPHSINTVIKGGDVQEIAATMLKSKNPGCYVGGDIEIPVEEPISGQSYIMRFYRPVPVSMTATIQVKIGDNVPQDYATTVKQQIVNYINKLEFGTEIYPFQVVSAVNVADLEVTDFKIAKQGETESTNIIALNFTEEAEISAENITVNIYANS